MRQHFFVSVEITETFFFWWYGSFYYWNLPEKCERQWGWGKYPGWEVTWWHAVTPRGQLTLVNQSIKQPHGGFLGRWRKPEDLKKNSVTGVNVSLYMHIYIGAAIDYRFTWGRAMTEKQSTRSRATRRHHPLSRPPITARPRALSSSNATATPFKLRFPNCRKNYTLYFLFIYSCIKLFGNSLITSFCS